MKCKKVQQYLPDYITGDLDSTTADAIREHIKNCESCRSELLSYKSYINELSSVKEGKAPDNFLDRIHERFKKQEKTPTLREKLFQPLNIKIPLEAAGVLAIALVVFFFWRPYEAPTTRFSDMPQGYTETHEIEKNAPRSGPEAASETPAGDATELLKSPERAGEAPAEPDKAVQSRARKKSISQASMDTAPALSREPAVTVELALLSGSEKQSVTTAAGPSPETEQVLQKKEDSIRKQSYNSVTPLERESMDKTQASKNADITFKTITRQCGGTVIDMHVNSQGHVEYYDVLITAHLLDTYLVELNKLGTISRSPESIPDKSANHLTIRIYINR